MDKKGLAKCLKEAQEIINRDGSDNSYAYAFGFLESCVTAFIKGGEKNGKQKQA